MLDRFQNLIGYAQDTTHFVYNNLQSAFTALQSALPSAYQSQFAVYDLGFYHHHTSYEGGIPDVMQQAIAGLATSYYLVFGREMNRDGELEKVWVEMELPEGDFLSCLEPSQRAFHTHMVSTFLNSPAIIGTNSSFLFVEQIKASFDYLTAVFTQLDDCCDQQSGLRSVPQCSHCTQDVNEFRSFMEANGFVGIEVENLVASTYYDTTGNIREYAEITLELAGEPLNVNEDVIGFLLRMDNAMEGVYGSLYYYDPLDPLCERIMEVVSGTYSLPVAFRESDVSRAASEEVVLEITTIGTVDENGDGTVHMKVEIPIEMTNTGKTIYLQCVGDCGFDMDSIKNYLINFYSLLGKYPAEVWPEPPATGPPVTDSIDLIPDIQIATQQLTKEIVKDGVVVLYGGISKILESVAHEHQFSLPFERDDIIEYLGETIDPPWKHPNVLESARGAHFAMVKTIGTNSDLIDSWAANSHNHLAAFLTFHSNGHNAGKKHRPHQKSEDYCQSYMSRGTTITVGYLGKQRPPFSVVWGGKCYELHGASPFTNLNEFVYETMKHSRYFHLKTNLYDRFFK